MLFVTRQSGSVVRPKRGRDVSHDGFRCEPGGFASVGCTSDSVSDHENRREASASQWKLACTRQTRVVYHDLRMNSRDQVMILIVRPHISLVRDTEQIELFVAWAYPGCGVWHFVVRLGEDAAAARRYHARDLARGQGPAGFQPSWTGDRTPVVLCRGVNPASRC